MIDQRGFRPNIAIIIANQEGKLFWGKRHGKDGWQFPQGGIDDNETEEQALFRELWEEVGLTADDVEIVARTRSWLYYRIPKPYIRWRQKPVCRGQKQRWYLLRLITDDSKFKLDNQRKQEFDEWKWVDYWYPIEHIIEFKRKIYRKVLREFEGKV